MLALVDRACQWNCFRCNGLRSEAALSSIETAYLRCENSKLKEATERQQSICDSLIKQERQRCSVLLRKQKKLQEELKERRQEAQLAAAELFEDGCVLNTDIVRLPACPLVEGRNLLVF